MANEVLNKVLDFGKNAFGSLTSGPVSDLVNTGANFASTLITNKRNIQAQKDINAQNIAFQKAENELTRQREDNAYQRAASDIEKAGMSKQLLNGGASAQALTAPSANAMPKMDAPQFDGNNIGGLYNLAMMNSVSKLADSIKGIGGNNGNGASPGNDTGKPVATVTRDSGDVTVDFIEPTLGTSSVGHFDTRSVKPQKFVASPISADGTGFSLGATSNVLKESVAPTAKAGMAQAVPVLRTKLSNESKNALVSYLKLTSVDADGNIGFNYWDGFTRFSPASYEKYVPKLLEPVCTDLISKGVVANQAEAQLYIKDLAYTVHTEDARPSQGDLEKLIGLKGYGKSSTSAYHKVSKPKSGHVDSHYIEGGANGANRKSHN